MKLLMLFLIIMITISYSFAQNRIGINTEIQYQESPGVYRTAKFDGVWQIILIGTHDPEWQVQRKGETVWNGSFQWLKYLGTDGNIWITRTHAEQNDAHHYHLWLESKRPNGDGDNPTFQFVDWSGKKWNVDRIFATPDGNSPHPVTIILSKVN